MAPLIQAPDVSASSHDELFDLKTIIAPLNEIENTDAPRSVSFFPMSVTYDIMSKDDYSSDEFKASWFDIDDMRRMKQDARSTAKLYGSGNLVLGEDFSIRGLEHRTREGMKRKRQARLNNYAAVFFELDKQRKNDVYTQELVAHASSFYSQHSARLAQSLGKQDAAEAIVIHRQCKNGDSFGANYVRKVIVNLISERQSKC